MENDQVNNLDQGLGALSLVLILVFAVVVLTGAVAALRSPAGRSIARRMQRWVSGTRVGAILRLPPPAEGTRFAAGVSTAMRGEVLSTMVLSLEHDIQPAGWLAVVVPPDLRAWTASNLDLAEGVTHAELLKAGVEAVVAVNARKFVRTGSHHAEEIRAQARKRGRVMDAHGVAFYASEGANSDAFVVAVGHSQDAARVNAVRLSGADDELTSLSRVTSRDVRPTGSESAAAAAAKGRAAERVQDDAAPTRSAAGAPGPTRGAPTRGVGPVATATVLTAGGTDTTTVTEHEGVTIGRNRDCDLQIAGDLSVSNKHLTVQVLPGGDCVEVRAYGRTGTWITDAHGVTKHHRAGSSTIVRLPASAVLGDARTTVVHLTAG